MTERLTLVAESLRNVLCQHGHWPEPHGRRHRRTLVDAGRGRPVGAWVLVNAPAGAHRRRRATWPCAPTSSPAAAPSCGATGPRGRAAGAARAAPVSRCATRCTARLKGARPLALRPTRAVEGLSLGVDLARSATRWMPAAGVEDGAHAACRHRRRGGGAGGARRWCYQVLCAPHGARDLLGQAHRGAAGHRSPAEGTRLAADGIVLRERADGQGGRCPTTTAAAWTSCWPRNWRPRRCATRWS